MVPFLSLNLGMFFRVGSLLGSSETKSPWTSLSLVFFFFFPLPFLALRLVPASKVLRVG